MDDVHALQDCARAHLPVPPPGSEDEQLFHRGVLDRLWYGVFEVPA
jgi:hypothetical protein